MTFLLAVLTVVETGGRFQVLRDGVPFVSSIVTDRGAVDETDVQSSFAKRADGTKVWNRWSQAGDRSFRMEVGERADGAVELTMQAQIAFDSDIRKRWLELSLPHSALDGRRYRSVVATVRRFEPVEGAFDADFVEMKSRWMAVDGLTFDFNPIGPGDDEACDSEGWSHQDSMRGTWYVRKEEDRWTIRAGATPPTPWGGYVGAKLVIREGTFDDYDRIHAIRDFFYGQEMSAFPCLSFGAPKAGKRYSDGNVPYAESRGYGWQTDGRGARPAVGHPEGANYSHVSGEGEATYRLAPLRDGVHFLTFTAGNFPGGSNRFGVTVGGEALVDDVSVPSGKVFSVTRPVRVTDGRLDVCFSGRWIVSSLAVQPVILDAEDYSFRRGVWLADGWEPTHFHRNDTVKTPPAFTASRELRDLPAPGTEFAASPREPAAETLLPDPDAPSLDWTHDARIVRIFNNSSTLAELDAPGAIKTYFDREIAGKGYNVVMLSGMHSRHTYAGQEARGQEAVRRIAAEAHRRGMKLIDHFDATLVWNIGEGFRVLCERQPELIRSRYDGLPSYQFCPNNPVFRKTLHDYLVRDVENGVDGFQVDEVQFWHHGCTCRWCREAFRRDTGWWIPENELDAAWESRWTPFMKRWHGWKVRQATNFFLELRRRVQDIKPDLVLSAYTTPGGFQYPSPRVNHGRDLNDLARTFNFFGLEIMSRCVMRDARFTCPILKAQNFFGSDFGTPMWDWYYNADWQNDYVAWALSTMAGRSPMLAEVEKDASVPDYPGFGVAQGAMKRRGATPVAEAAVLFSVASRDWNEDAVFFAKEFAGAAQALEALHVPYEVISDRALETGALGKYKALFVGAAHCLSDRAIASVRAFAERGGTVWLSAKAGLFDERGDARAVWPFNDVFGFAPTLEPRSRKVVTRPCGKGRIVYTPALRGEECFLPEQSPSRVCQARPSAAADANFRREMADWTKDASWWRIKASDKVYTAVWREKDGSVVIHFLNLTGVPDVQVGETPSSRAPDPAFPSLAEDLVFTVPEGRSAVAVSPDFAGARALSAVRNADGTLTVTLPVALLRAYTLVRVAGMTGTEGSHP